MTTQKYKTIFVSRTKIKTALALKAHYIGFDDRSEIELDEFVDAKALTDLQSKLDRAVEALKEIKSFIGGCDGLKIVATKALIEIEAQNEN